jgi:hypothetical protein
MLRGAIISLPKPLYGCWECHQQKQLLLIVASNFELVMVMAEQYALITWHHSVDPSRWINNIVRRFSKLACGSKPAHELISVTGLRNVPWQAQQKLSQDQVRVRQPRKRTQSVTLLTCIWLEFRSPHSRSSPRFIFVNPSRQLPGLYLEIKQQTPYTSIPIHYTLTIRPFDATLRKTSLNHKWNKFMCSQECEDGQNTNRPTFVGNKKDIKRFGWWTLWKEATYYLQKPSHIFILVKSVHKNATFNESSKLCSFKATFQHHI